MITTLKFGNYLAGFQGGGETDAVDLGLQQGGDEECGGVAG